MQFIVNGIVWKIKFIRPNSRKLQRSDKSYTVGSTDARTRTVFLSQNLHGRMLEKVLCHEICHCICFSYGLLMSLETEEIVADWIATYGRETFYILDTIKSYL